MLKSCELSKSSYFYYDLESKAIARFPTKSNLILKGSDNSLYFGMITNDRACEVLRKLFKVKKIEDIENTVFKMACGNNDVDVVFNINAQGQLQFKLLKDGVMNKLAGDYAFKNDYRHEFTKMLLVLDFKNLTIRFKDSRDLVL